MKFLISTGESYNKCSNCGTLNYFDEDITSMYSRAYCYYCGELIAVPGL